MSLASLRPDAVAVTGLGAVTPFGWGLARFREGLRGVGQAAIGDFARFDHARHRTHIAGEVPAEAEDLAQDARRALRLSFADRFAIFAAREALASSGLERGLLLDAGLFFSSSTGGMFESENYIEPRMSGGALGSRIGALCSQQYNGPTDAVARDLRIGGPVQTVSSACASATISFGQALDAIASGEIDVAIAGGSDSLCRITYGGFNALRSIDERACRPFRADRAGLSLGEGAGVLVLESAAHAAARGGRVLGWLAGSGQSCDRHHMTAPHPEGQGPSRAISEAIANAGLEPGDIDFVNVHGTGTPHNDAAESRALLHVFGERTARLPVTATKGLIGHLLGAAGAAEAVATLLDLHERLLHASSGEGPVDETARVDLVLGAPRALDAARVALSTNLGFGGTNAAVVLARADVREAAA